MAALPTGRSPNASAIKWQANHQKTPFTTKKEIRRGEISKNKAKGFSGGASGRVRPQALGLSLHGSAILLEISSDLVGVAGIGVDERKYLKACFRVLRRRRSEAIQ